MSRTRDEIKKDIEKIQSSQAKLQGDLVAFERQESEALAKVEDEFLSTGASKSSISLSDLRVKKAIVQEGLSIVSNNMRRLQGEFQDLERGEALHGWFDFKSTLPARVNKIQSLLGALRNEMDATKRELDSFSSQVEKDSQDAIISHRGLTQLLGNPQWAQFSKVLNEFEQNYMKK